MWSHEMTKLGNNIETNMFNYKTREQNKNIQLISKIKDILFSEDDEDPITHEKIDQKFLPLVKLKVDINNFNFEKLNEIDKRIMKLNKGIEAFKNSVLNSLTKHGNYKELSKENNIYEHRKVKGADKEYFIDSYCCTQELSGKGDYGSFGTLCHEYSHCFGLPDFYYGSSCIVGSWDLMDNGNYNGNGFRPCGYSAFERAFMGWLTPEELTGKTSVDGLPALSTQPKAYIVRNDGHPDEYYVIENRQKIGWDEKLPGSGILIFHVDYDDYIFRHAMPNERVKRYTIIPANNKTIVNNNNIKGWAYPNNGNNSLTNTTEPAAELNNMNSDSTLFMNKPITGMAVVSSMAQFKFCYPIENGMVPATEEPAKDHGWFTIDGRQLLAPPTGKGMYIHDGKLLLIK